jgi:multidrug efflux pump subunit AcrA (membrane-fusion protein)
MFAEVNVDTVHKDGVVCIPVAAVLPKEGFSIAYVVDKDRKARSVTVETGIKNNDYVEITKGIKAGQEVITKGNTLVNEGTLVKVVAGGGK